MSWVLILFVFVSLLAASAIGWFLEGAQLSRLPMSGAEPPE